MFPESFTERLKTQKYLNAATLLRALEEPSPSSIRINRAKWDKNPSAGEPVPWCTSGYYLEKRPSYKADPLFHAGCYYPQEASSMFIEEVFRQVKPASGKIRILDLCGAPGGKSTHLSALAGSDGWLIANDVIRSRADILYENITRWGPVNTLVTWNDPADFRHLKGFFDMILVDAPCSGEGMFRDISAVKQWSEAHLVHCSARQKRILTDVWPALREGGILIYSTCTFNPDENEHNLKWFSEKAKAGFVKLDISRFNMISEILYEGTAGYAFYPDKAKGEGFFISVLRKEEKHIPEKQGFAKFSLSKPAGNDLKILKEWTTLDVNSVFRSGDGLFFTATDPDEFIFLSRYLKIVKSGLKVCSIKGNSYIPSPELALSSTIRTDTFPAVELAYDEAISYLRRDKITCEGAERGWNVVRYKGVNLGFINNTGNRINNYFPLDWRIRNAVTQEETNDIIAWSDMQNDR